MFESSTPACRVFPCLAFGFHLFGNFGHHRNRCSRRCFLYLTAVFLPIVPAEPSACGQEGNDGDDPQEFGKGCFKRLRLGGKKVGFADAVGSKADVFCFVAPASAFDDFKRYALAFGGRVR